MRNFTLAGGLALLFALSGCQITDAVSEAHAGDASWKKTRAGKTALKHRPKGHPKGKPWVKLWEDTSSTSNDAKELKVSCNKKKENKICNGLDDDCDGKIDEECGLEHGAGGMQIAIGWDHHAQMDLQVIYSSWEKAGNNHDGGESRLTYEYGGKELDKMYIGGGRDGATMLLQKNGKGSCSCSPRYVNGERKNCGAGCKEIRGACWADDRSEYVENAYLDVETAPPGVYHINFYNRGDCPRKLEQLRVNLGISVNGETVGHYRSGDLGPQGFSFPILTLYVPPK